mmetsp:Transcript_13739/g.17902  ORF Transcript_13739/g.17902 Transcript_13739/m.17902 type:complete len:311 (-) Transcript_13739:45-977(-)
MNQGNRSVYRTERQEVSIEQAAFSTVKSLLANPKFRTAVAFWALGLFLCLFAQAPFTVSEEKQQIYEGLLDRAHSFEGYAPLEEELYEAQTRLDEVHVWFWRFREPYSRLVPERKQDVAEVMSRIKVLDVERDKMIVEAKSTVGIWSQYSIDEARSKFWNAFEKGKVFAKRRSFWDTLFMVMSRKDENVISFVLSWVFQVIINFTFGLIGSLFYFTFAVISLVYSYSPGILSGLLFVGLALLAAASMVLTYLLGIYGCAAGGLYMTGKIAQHAANQQRLEQEHQRARLRAQQQQYSNNNRAQPSSHYHQD